jgi:ergosteryl-3beta-O-L-aspartate synthase
MAASLKKALGKLNPNKDSKEQLNTGVVSDGDSSIISSPLANSNGQFSHPKADTFPQTTNSPRTSGIFTRIRERRGSGSRNHGHSHSPIRAVKEKLGITSDSSDEGSILLNRDGEKMSKNQLRKAERQAEREQKAELAREREKAVAERIEHMEKEAEVAETEAQRAKYGDLPVNMYAAKPKNLHYTNFSEITSDHVGKEIIFRARVHAMRRMSARLAFFLFRQSTRTLQGVLEQGGDLTKYFLFWAERVEVESVVLVKGVVQKPKAKEGEVTGASIHEWEILITELHVQGRVSEHLPYAVQEGELTAKKNIPEGDEKHVISQKVRLANRVIDLRTTASQSIFRIQSGICYFFREYLDSQGFIEIHTPKLQGGATESGASVFKVDYFGRSAFLAQSPQLAKQMSISSDFGRVYEIGAVFRAENSNTHRHLTEYTGLDLEMTIDENYHEVLTMIDNTFKHIFKGLYSRYRHEIEVVKEAFPHEDLVWLDKTPVIPFAQGIRLLNESGWRDENGKPLPEDEDMGTRDEIQLGRVIKEKYKTDYYILDKFPVSARPFYAMPDQNDSKVTNGFDIFLRGQEILSGGQRIHDAALLLEKLEIANIDRASMEEYIQGFEYAAPPHGGGGIGLERMLMLFLNLGDIRNASLFHRDPKSFPTKPVVTQLRHPEASTTHPPWIGKDRFLAGQDLQPLEKLIANYGDASNTSWLEDRTKIWRDQFTGAAVGYTPQDGFAIIVGDPLCAESQFTKTIAGFLKFIKKEAGLKPLWLLVGAAGEEVLATRFNWRSFSVTAEQRLDPSTNPAAKDTEIQKKVRHAEKEVKLVDIPNGKEVPQDVRDKVEARIQDWLANRKGKQVHLTNLHPWQDIEHRQYHYAIDKEGKIHAIVVLAQLSPRNGWQVKYALDFPGAPGGTIEYLILHSLKRLAADGVTNCTFGGGATASFTPGHNMKGAKTKVLAKAYSAIVSELKLTNKSEFREKLGAQDDPVYICYPPHGLGAMGVRAILSFFEDD